MRVVREQSRGQALYNVAAADDQDVHNKKISRSLSRQIGDPAEIQDPAVIFSKTLAPLFTSREMNVIGR